MLIPVSVETAEDFIGRAKDRLAEENTHVYVDTSMLMWLTAVGPSSRAVFIDWASTLGERIHVPTWSVHEYYRHHQRRSQVNEIAEKCSAVEKALKDLKSHMRVYADGPLVPERPDMTFQRDLEAASEHVENAIKLAQAWDYDAAALEVIAWMNSRALATTGVFERFADLKQRGSVRYGHEVPPGFEDGHKGVNRFGDLIFWEDVIGDAGARPATTAVVLTRDRKKDWFFSGLEGEPGEELRRLRGRWNPVPVAHPMLTLEMSAKARADLLLLDELYLGGVMWLTDKHRFGRLAAVTFGMDLARLEAATKPAPGIAERAAKRDAKQTIGYAEANRVIKAAKADEERAAILDILASLDGGAPSVEAALTALTPDSLNVMDFEDLAVLAKRLYDGASAGPSAKAAAARRLLDAVDHLDAQHASAVVGGMIIAAYVENGVPRSEPTGQLLQELLEWRLDTGVTRVVEASARELQRLRSPAPYLPSVSTTPIEVRIESSESNTTTPVAIGQIYIGLQGLLVDPPLQPDASLSMILGGVEVATVGEIVSAVGRHFGFPINQLHVADADHTEERTILSTTGLDRFEPLRLPVSALNKPAIAVKMAAEIIAAAPVGGDGEMVDGEPNAPAEQDGELTDDDLDSDDDAMIDEEDLP